MDNFERLVSLGVHNVNKLRVLINDTNVDEDSVLVDITELEADKALKSGVLSIFLALKSRVLSILSAQPEK